MPAPAASPRLPANAGAAANAPAPGRYMRAQARPVPRTGPNPKGDPRMTSKNVKRLAAAAVLAAVLGAGGGAWAEEKKAVDAPAKATPAGATDQAAPNTLTDNEKADGWKLLF